MFDRVLVDDGKKVATDMSIRLLDKPVGSEHDHCACETNSGRGGGGGGMSIYIANKLRCANLHSDENRLCWSCRLGWPKKQGLGCQFV